MSTRRATAFLQLEQSYTRSGVAVVRGVTQKYPSTIQDGCVVVKVVLDIDASAWAPLDAGLINVSVDQTSRTVDVVTQVP